MRTLYYDCFAGISGDMNLGALIELGVDPLYLQKELSKLGLDREFELKIKKGIKNGISGTKVDVCLSLGAIDGEAHLPDYHTHDPHHDHTHDHTHDHEHDHSHDHLHEHPHHHGASRHYGDILKLITESDLSDRTKRYAIQIFEEVAIAEGKIHGKSKEQVHFHEVGAIDSIVDVVGAAICLDALDVEMVLVGKVEVGSGFVRCAHGLMPVPAPATAEILTGYTLLSKVEKHEMTTPTGAAILKGMKASVCLEKDFTVEKIGYGLGTWTLEIPNVLRVMLLEEKKNASRQWLIETNIDDMSSEQLVYAEEKLLAQGALDVFKTPIIMKKGRPAIKLSVLTKEETMDILKKTIVTETTAIGMRVIAVEKVKLERKYVTLDTPIGPVTLKQAFYEGVCVNEKPEYEEVKALAVQHNLPLKAVYDLIYKRKG